MNYFDEKNEFDNLDKKIFDDNYKKQIKYTKKIFKILGIIFFSLAIVLLILSFVLNITEISIPSIPFGIIGLIFIILGFVFPESYNYEAIKKRQNKYGCLNIYEMNAKIIMLEEKNNALEAKVKELENEISKLK